MTHSTFGGALCHKIEQDEVQGTLVSSSLHTVTFMASVCQNAVPVVLMFMLFASAANAFVRHGNNPLASTVLRMSSSDSKKGKILVLGGTGR